MKVWDPLENVAVPAGFYGRSLLERLFGLVCVCVSAGGSWSSGGGWGWGGLRGAAVVNDVVVVDVHEHGDGLADDERDPHGGVPVDPVQVAAHEQRQRNLQGEELQVRRCGGRAGAWGRLGGETTYLGHHPHEGPQAEHPQRNAHQVLENGEKRVGTRQQMRIIGHKKPC